METKNKTILAVLVGLILYGISITLFLSPSSPSTLNISTLSR